MSAGVEVVSALLSSLVASGLVEKAADILRQRLREKGVEQPPAPSSAQPANEAMAVPAPSLAEEAQLAIEVMLAKEERRLGAAGIRDLTLEAIQAAHDAATGVRNERMRQARFTFNAALGLAVLGVVIIFSGVTLLLFREAVATGALTAGVGAVTEVVSAILFRLNHETNNRLDEIGRDLSAIEAARIVMSLIERIGDPAKKDDAIMVLAEDLRSRRRDAAAVSKKAKNTGGRA